MFVTESHGNCDESPKSEIERTGIKFNTGQRFPKQPHQAGVGKRLKPHIAFGVGLKLPSVYKDTSTCIHISSAYHNSG